MWIPHQLLYMASLLLNAVYTGLVLLAAIGGVAAVMWFTRTQTGGETDRESEISGTMITIAIAVFTIATAALLLS